MNRASHRVILPLLVNSKWRRQAACAEEDYTMLNWWDDHVDDESQKDRLDRHERAVRVCRSECPVRSECSDSADWKIDEGIHGGHKIPPRDRQRTPLEEDMYQLLRQGKTLDEAARRASLRHSPSRAST